MFALAACGPRLEIALASPATAAPGLVALTGPTPRSELVMAGVDLLLRAAGVERSQVEGVVAARGPGSFTGVRVALATAQGLATGLGIPAHGFSSLLAQAARTEARACLAVQPARRGTAYAQPFVRHDSLLEPGGDPKVVPLTELASSGLPVVAPDGMELAPGTPLAEVRLTTVEALLELMARQQHPDPATLTPFYVEPPPASRPTERAPAWPPSPTAS